jgi:hypothetical protein
MTSHHLPQLITHLASVGRHVLTYWHAAMRAMGGAISQLQSPRDAFRVALRQGRFASKVRLRKPPLLIHYHIFKNAGTSFEWALEQALGKGFRSFDTSSPGGFISGRNFREFAGRNPEVKAISSHQAAPPAPRIPGRELVTSILIRDPIARVRSIYAFERRQQASSPGAVKAKELNFKQYVEWRLETSPALLCNFQVHFCSRMEDNRMLAPGREYLEEAIANLDTISIVGTVARYGEWLALAEKILSGLFPNVTLPFSRQNANLGDDPSEAAILEELITELGDATAQHLLENNQLDMCLHQVADALLTRRLAEHGMGLALVQAYARAQQDRQLSSAQTSDSNQ